MSHHKRKLMSQMLNWSFGSSREGATLSPSVCCCPHGRTGTLQGQQGHSSSSQTKAWGTTYSLAVRDDRSSQVNMMADSWEKSPFSSIACKPEMMAIGNEDGKDEAKCKETALEKMLCGSELLWTWWGVQSITNTPLKEAATKTHHRFMSCAHVLQWHFTY